MGQKTLFQISGIMQFKIVLDLKKYKNRYWSLMTFSYISYFTPKALISLIVFNVYELYVKFILKYISTNLKFI